MRTARSKLTLEEKKKLYYKAMKLLDEVDATLDWLYKEHLKETMRRRMNKD